MLGFIIAKVMRFKTKAFFSLYLYLCTCTWVSVDIGLALLQSWRWNMNDLDIRLVHLLVQNLQSFTPIAF